MLSVSQNIIEYFTYLICKIWFFSRVASLRPQFKTLIMNVLTSALFFSLLLSHLNRNLNAQEITPIDLVKFCSEQKGFNLLGKFDVSWSNDGYSQAEFKLIHELGFNFVRLPIDYRTYTQAGDWNRFLETEIAEIDNAVKWGQENNVHVCINLHRAPGYCVNAATLPVNQQLDLWTDTVAQNAFVRHWAFFTNRYKDFAPAVLSFNLVNEPSNVSEALYLPLMKRAIDTIHSISPDRIIFVDGLNYGSDVLPALKDEPNVAQAMHCYQPFALTHYKAEWATGSDLWPVPRWPMLWISGYLYGPWKADFKSPLIFEGNFTKGTEIIINVNQVSIESTLQVKANAKIAFTKKFVCGADTGADFSQIVNTEWGYQNISNKNFVLTLSEDVTRLSFENTTGDWMIINSISTKNGTATTTYYLSDGTWGRKQATYKIDGNGIITASDGSDLLPFENYKNNIAIANQYNIPLMVQEFGVYNKTPHTVAVGFLDDLVQFFYENNIGWALWNFSGSFGILNSDRSDCSYETYQGYKLDRDMLNALTSAKAPQSVSPEKNNRLNFYISPDENSLSIYNHPFQGKCSFGVYDISGRLIRTHQIDPISNDIIKIDVSNLRTGTYILTTAKEGIDYSGKFIISK
jgi:aryl-phospho-beta-D-glucosidase BglC (GH1 family)